MIKHFQELDFQTDPDLEAELASEEAFKRMYGPSPISKIPGISLDSRILPMQRTESDLEAENSSGIAFEHELEQTDPGSQEIIDPVTAKMHSDIGKFLIKHDQK
jgi:hypothetical protein